MKKIGVLFIITALIVSLNTGVLSFSDLLPDAPYEKEVGVVSALGLIRGVDENRFMPKDSMTRGEFVALAVRLSGIEDAGAYGQGKMMFLDVPAGNEHSGDIAMAYDLGLISGNEHAMFYPDRFISYSEAVKILVHVLGYEFQAASGGGYPTGYLAVASTLGIGKGLSLTGDAYVSRGEAAMIVCNSLHIELMQKTPSGGDLVHRKAEDATLLAVNLKMGYIKGRMTANSRTSLTGAYTNKNEVEVEFTSFSDNTGAYDELLGQEVECYYKDDDNRTVVYLLPTDRNTVLAVKSEDIASYSGRTLFYTSGVRTNQVRVPADVYVIYNNMSYEYYPEDVFDIGQGSITFIDNNLDGSVDIAKIEEYENCLLTSIDVQAEKLYIKGEPAINLEEYDGGNAVIIDTVTGKRLGAEDLTANTLLSVLKGPLGTPFVTIYANNKIVTGMLSEVSDETVVIDGVTYRKSAALSLDGYVGSDVRIFLDFKGIATMPDTKHNADGKYGFILGGALGDTTFQEDPKLKIYTEDGVKQEYSVSTRLSVDGEAEIGRNILAVLEQRAMAAGLSDGVSQMVKYKADAEGNIYYIDTAYRGAEESDTTLVLSRSSTTRTHYRNTGIFAGEFAVKTDAKIFIIPTSPAVRLSDDARHKNLFGIQTRSYLVTDDYYPETEKHTRLDAYGFNDANASDLLVLYMADNYAASGVPTNYKTNVMLIERINEVYDSESHEKNHKIYGFQSGNAVEMSASADISATVDFKTEYSAGDVVAFSAINGVLTGIKMLFDYKENAAYTYPSSYTTTDGLFYGRVVSSDGEFMVLKFSEGGGDKRVFSLLSNVLVFDTSKNKCRIGTTADIMGEIEYSDAEQNAFVYANYGATRFIAVYTK